LGDAGASVVWVEAADDQAAGFQPVQQRGQGVLSSPSTWPGASWVRPGSAICADSTIQSRAPSQFLRLGHIERREPGSLEVEHLTNLLDKTQIVPAVNQIELHPYFQQPEVQAFNAEHGIVTQAWSPIGGITFYREGEHTSTLEDPIIVKIAESHSKSPAQVMLRWHLQERRSVIPKSTKPRRIAENFDVFDFEFTADEVAAIDGLDTGKRGGPEPDAITLESFGREIPEV
jgi:hypothetical protein